MTSYVDIDDDGTSGTIQDGCMFLVHDAPAVDCGLPRYSKFVTGTSFEFHDSSSQTSVSTDSGSHRRRLITLHRKAFDVDSARDLRVKRPEFAFQLDRLQRKLQQQLSHHFGINYQSVWPAHCIVLSCGDRGAINHEADRKLMTHYARGFLVTLPDIQSPHTAQVASGYVTSGAHRDKEMAKTLTDAINESLKELEFEVSFELTKSISTLEDVWTVRPSDAAKSVISNYSSMSTGSTSPSSATGPINLVSLVGGELDEITRHPPAFEERSNNVVFQSMDEVRRVLSETKAFSDRDDSDKVDELLKMAVTIGANVDHESRAPTQHYPFIVVEGLDATGKSTVVSGLVHRLNACQLYSPPTSIQHLRSIFDTMPSVVRRAYYSLGNYLVGETAKDMTSHKAVVLDRYWHSTAAYAIAEESLLPSETDHWVYKWPRDLFKPAIIILLVVTEDERLQRLQTRESTQGTAQTNEERQLAVDESKRHRILEAYRKMNDPGVIEISAQGSPDQVLHRVLDALTPIIASRDFI